MLATLALVAAQTVAPVTAPSRPHEPAVLRSVQATAPFIENVGQWPEAVRFMARGAVSDLTVVGDGFVLRPTQRFGRDGEPLERTSGVYFQFVQANGTSTAADVAGVAPGSTQHHFFHQVDGHTGALGFESVRLEDVAPGVDVRLRLDEGRFAYDLHFDAGTSVDSIEVALWGVQDALVDSTRRATLSLADGTVFHRVGESWTESAAGRRAIDATAQIDPQASVIRFEAHARDLSAPLVIDPTVGFLTYLGGAGVERALECALDPEGRTILAMDSGGLTPTLPSELDGGVGGGSLDVWVGRITADGSSLDYATFIGGSFTEQIENVYLRSDGRPMLVGQAFSEDFPTTAVLSTEGTVVSFWTSDVFVTVLEPDGDALAWSTRLGSADSDVLEGSALGIDDGAYIVFQPNSWQTGIQYDPVLPPLPELGYDDEYTIGDTFTLTDKLIVRIAPDGQSITHATWLETQNLRDATVGPSGELYLTGTANKSFPTTPGAALSSSDANGGGSYVLSLSASLADLRWSAFASIDGGASPFGIDVDASGAVYLTNRSSNSTAFTHEGSFQPGFAGTQSGYVQKVSPHGTRLIWGSYLGDWFPGGGAGYPGEITVDTAGRPLVVGQSNSDGWPLTPNALQPDFVGPSPTGDLAMTLFDSVGDSLVYSSWIGGNSNDWFASIDMSPDGLALIAFETKSSDLAPTPGAFQSTVSELGDAAIATFDFGPPAFEVLGHGLKGSLDQPVLVGTGSNVPGTTTRLSLRAAVEDTPVFLVVGLSEIHVPLLGGTLVPAPDLVEPLTTGPEGGLDLEFTWPDPGAGFVLTTQAWCIDPAAPNGVQASNALRVIGH